MHIISSYQLQKPKMEYCWRCKVTTSAPQINGGIVNKQFIRGLCHIELLCVAAPV